MHFPSYNYGYGSNGYNEYGGMIQDPERRAANQVAYQAALARRQAAALNRAQGGPGTSGNPLPMSQPYDPTNFDQMFHPKPEIDDATASPSPATTTAMSAPPRPLGPLGSSANPIPLSPAHDWTNFNRMFPNGIKSSLPTPVGVTSNNILPAALDPDDYLRMHADLYRNNPAVFTPGTPENAAIVDHAVQYGPASAYRNANTILAPFRQQQEAGGPADPSRVFNPSAFLV